MVCPDSHKISRVSCYLGAQIWRHAHFAYRAITFYGLAFQPIVLCTSLVTPVIPVRISTLCPATLSYATAYTLARMEFRLIPVRSSLLRESLTISFPPATEIFHFAGFSLLYFDVRNRLPHSDIHGYNGYWHLTVAFRSQSRLSSSLLPKASII